MTTALPFIISGWSAWTEGIETPEHWRVWADAAPGTGLDARDPAIVPASLRRRAGPLGHHGLACALAGPHVAEARYIVATRHGEFPRTLSLLDKLAIDEPPSPTDFSLSVHHAISGLLSIAAGNRKGHTAVSAGVESFCFGLLEAAACLVEKPDEPVMLLHYDELPGGAFTKVIPETQHIAPMVIALDLVSGNQDGTTMTVSAVPDEDAAGMRQSSCPALDFLRFVLDGRALMYWTGSSRRWEWRRV